MPGPAAWHDWLAFGEAAVRYLSLNWVCQSTALLLTGLAVSRLPRMTAASRHRALLAALVLAAAAPGAELLPVRVQAPVLVRHWGLPNGGAAPGTAAVRATAKLRPAGPAQAAVALPPALRLLQPAAAHAGWLLLGAWLLVVLVRLARLQAGIWTVSRWRRRAAPADRDALYAACRYSVADIRVLECELVPMPCVAGVVEPCILLPAGMTQSLEVPDLRNVLFQEEAHARRRDPLWFLLTEISYTLLFWHPLARVARRQIAALAEDACDAHVLRRGTPGTSYARTLLAVLEHASLSRTSPVLCPFGSAGSELRRRVVRILAGSPRTSRLMAGVGSLTVAAASAAALTAQVGVRPLLPQRPRSSLGTLRSVAAASFRRSALRRQVVLPLALRPAVIRPALGPGRGKPGLFGAGPAAPGLAFAEPRETLPREARCVVFVLDQTPGMVPHASEAREQILTMVQALSPGDQFDVVTFGGEVRRFAEFPVSPGLDSVVAVRAWMESLSPAEGTTASAAMEQALQMPAVSAVVLVSAELATPRAAGWAELLSVADRRNPSGAGVLSLDLGQTAASENVMWTEMATPREPGLRAVQSPQDNLAP